MMISQHTYADATWNVDNGGDAALADIRGAKAADHTLTME
jgi:hypothetical protein